MAVTYKNKASLLSVIGGINITTNSNEVTSTLAEDITMVKSQQYDLLRSGTTQTYSVTINNPNLLPVLAATFTDVLPAGVSFVTGSFKLNGVVASPTVVGQTITYVIASIPASGTVNIELKVLVA